MSDVTTTDPETEEQPDQAVDTDFSPEDIDYMLEFLAPQIEQRIAEAVAPLQAQLEEANGLIRGIDDYSTFADIAKELGIKPEAYDDVWELGKWESTGESADPTAMKAHFEKTIEGKPHFIAPSEPAPKQRLSADHHGNRGGSSPPPRRTVTSQQLNSLEWMEANKGTLSDPDTWQLAD
jgi:hypothetical protein